MHGSKLCQKVILVGKFSYLDYLLNNLMADYILTSIKIYNIIYWSLLQLIRLMHRHGSKV